MAGELGDQVGNERMNHQHAKGHIVKRIIKSWSHLRMDPVFLSPNCIPAGSTTRAFSDPHQHLSGTSPLAEAFANGVVLLALRGINKHIGRIRYVLYL